MSRALLAMVGVLFIGQAAAQQSGINWLMENSKSDDPEVYESYQKDFHEDVVKNLPEGIVLSRVAGAQQDLVAHFYFLKNFSDHDYCLRVYWPHGVAFEKRELAQVTHVESRETIPIGTVIGEGAGRFGQEARFVVWKPKPDVDEFACRLVLPEGVDWPVEPLR